MSRPGRRSRSPSTRCRTPRFTAPFARQRRRLARHFRRRHAPVRHRLRCRRATSAVRPGVSAAIAIAGPAFDNVLYVPRTAVFDVAGTADGLRARHGWIRRARSARQAPGPTASRSSRTPRRRPGDRSGDGVVNPNIAVGRPSAPTGAGRAAAGGAMTAAARSWLSTPNCGLPDLGRSIDNLLLHKLRTLLTMLGMIFGVAAVRRDAVDRRRRAAAGHGVHRGPRRPQPDRRSARDDRVPGVPEGPPAVAGPDVPGRPRDGGNGARPGHR